MGVSALLSRSDGSDELVELKGGSAAQLDPKALLWVDLDAPSDDEVVTVTAALKLETDAERALRARLSRPRAAIYAGIIDVALTTIDVKRFEPIKLHVMVGDNWVLTRHDESLPFLQAHRDSILDDRELGRLNAAEFLVSVLDWHLETFFEVADALESGVDKLDDAALQADDDLLDDLVGARRRIAAIRRVLVPHREVFAELGRPDFLLEKRGVPPEALIRLNSRLDRAIDAVANAREMLIGTFDIHMTRTAQRTNDVMRVLTVASVVLLPAVVVAGVMGMNFKVGIFDVANLFWVVVGGMLLLAVATLVTARWRGWL